MAVKTAPGVVVADTIEVRFAWSGKVSRVVKRTGDRVRRGEVPAGLDLRYYRLTWISTSGRE